eukprot:m.1014415 g.1014415  ORF g.1014415 m.1014415 type:complete len:497 (-) comp24072_c0_seq5:3319-4809(-)
MGGSTSSETSTADGAIIAAPPTQNIADENMNGHYVGERVLLKGTGGRWIGGSFPATVCDIRKDDNTIKVQYDDGGYKRFPARDFSEHISGDLMEGYGLDFGSKDFEWADDQYNPITTVESKLSTLKRQLHDAVQKREFLKAHELKEQIAELSHSMYEIRMVEGRLLAAIRGQNFLKAHEIQQELEQMNALRHKELTPGQSPDEQEPGVVDIFKQASERAFKGGLAGAGAMVIQVTSLMWMRTTMNYQYRYGVSTGEALRTLYNQGGVLRFYRGIAPALLQGPLSRFGDTAANVGVLTLLNASENTRDLPVSVKTLGASLGAAAWRIFLMPLDTVKTMMQVEGKDAIKKLMGKARANGPTVFYHGALGASAATFAGHYPWFATYNTLDTLIPIPENMLPKLGRNAAMGFCASVVSDTTSNSLRVLKTYRQTSETKVGYVTAAKDIIKQDGLAGLFGRGLKTRILANGMQGVMFSVMWKYFDSVLNRPHAESSTAKSY